MLFDVEARGRDREYCDLVEAVGWRGVPGVVGSAKATAGLMIKDLGAG